MTAKYRNAKTKERHYPRAGCCFCFGTGQYRDKEDSVCPCVRTPEPGDVIIDGARMYAYDAYRMALREAVDTGANVDSLAHTTIPALVNTVEDYHDILTDQYDDEVMNRTQADVDGDISRCEQFLRRWRGKG